MLDGLGKEQMYNAKILTRKSEAYLSYCTANSLLLNFYNFASLECEKMEFQGNLFCISPVAMETFQHQNLISR